MLNMTHQGAARKAASIHFCPSIRRTDIVGSSVSFYFVSFFQDPHGHYAANYSIPK